MDIAGLGAAEEEGDLAEAGGSEAKAPGAGKKGTRGRKAAASAGGESEDGEDEDE